MFNKQDIIKVVIIIWIIGSAVYIGYDTWNDYKIRGVQQAYQAGFNDSAKQLIEKIQASQCKQAVEVAADGNKADIVDMKCLQQQASADQQTQQGTTKAPALPAKK